MCLMIYLLLLVVIIIIIAYKIRTRADISPYHMRMREGQRTDEAQGQSSRVSRPTCRIHPIRPSSTSACGENLAAGLPCLLMIRAFSRDTQRWHLCQVSVQFVNAHIGDMIAHHSNRVPPICGFCPSAVQPLEMHGRSDKLTPTRVIRWSDDAYVTHH